MIKRLAGRALQRMRARVRREQPLCPDCVEEGKPGPWDELDHIVSLEDGGTNDRDNLVGLCLKHHQAKTARDRGFKRGDCDASGVPVDPNHHWNVA